MHKRECHMANRQHSPAVPATQDCYEIVLTVPARRATSEALPEADANAVIDFVASAHPEQAAPGRQAFAVTKGESGRHAGGPVGCAFEPTRTGESSWRLGSSIDAMRVAGDLATTHAAVVRCSERGTWHPEGRKLVRRLAPTPANWVRLHATGSHEIRWWSGVGRSVGNGFPRQFYVEIVALQRVRRHRATSESCPIGLLCESFDLSSPFRVPGPGCNPNRRPFELLGRSRLDSRRVKRHNCGHVDPVLARCP